MSSSRPLLARGLSLAVACLLWGLAPVLGGGEPGKPPALTPEQQERLKERDRHRAAARKLQREGKFPEAIASARRMLAVEREVLGGTHPDVAGSLQLLAELHEAREDFAAAREARREVLAIRGKLLGAEHWRVGDARRALAHTELLSRLDGPARVRLAKARQLNASAVAMYQEGKVREAVGLAQEALALYKEVLGERHPDYATGLDNLAGLYRDQGEYGKAEPLYRQALALRKEVLGERHPHYATSLNNVAGLYRYQGEYGKAEPLYRQVLVIHKEVLGERHPHYATSLNNLALLDRDQGEYGKAEPLYRQALALWKEVLGERHPHYALSLNNLAGLYRAQGEYVKAEPLFCQALALRKEVLGERHPDYALSLNNLAALYHDQGEYGKAEPLFRQALVIHKEALGERHPDYALSLNNLAWLYRAQGGYGKAEPLYRQALATVTAHLSHVASGQAEQTQIAHLNHQRTFLDGYLSCPPAAATQAAASYEPVLPWKGAVTARQRLTRFARTALTGADTQTRDLFAQLQAVSRQLATLSHTAHGGKQAADLPRRLAELDARRERLEIDLSGRTADFRALHQSKLLTPADLQKALPADAALVDFLAYRRYGPKAKSTDHLLAFVITPGDIRRVELGPVEPIGAAVDAFLARVKLPPGRGADDPARVLRKAVWGPLEPALGGARLVLLAPDGPLCRLPFAALPSADGSRYLLEQTALAVVPVPQMLPELLAPRARSGEDRPPALLALGDIDFDAVLGAAQPLPPSSEAVPAWRRRRTGRPQHWERLPGTRGEVLALEDAFRKAVPQGKLTVLREGQATRGAFVQQAAGHDYLHLATHGFFAPRQVRSALQAAAPGGKSALRAAGAGAPAAPAGLHPGLLSGLVLAGANRPREEDDGVLTALEVAELDLSKVELAVLSACETGLGETAGGEGVLGLQRGFQIAGARTTVTSLWKVDDQATRRLMERFYHNYWEKGRGTLESLREAQLWLLTEGITRGVVLDDEAAPGPRRAPPFYWAAFVLAGDWR